MTPVEEIQKCSIIVKTATLCSREVKTNK